MIWGNKEKVFVLAFFFFFFFFLGHLLVGTEFKSVFADPLEHWYGRTPKTSVFPLGGTFSAAS